MRLVVLASGSAGNAAYLEVGPRARPTRLLLDAGLPRNELEVRLHGRARLGRAPVRRREPGPDSPLAQLDAVFVTHEHGDHAGAAATLGRPVVATDGTARAAALGPGTTRVRPGEPLELGACRVHPIALPHDAEEPVGYVFECLETGRRAGLLTDCGHLAPGLEAAYAGCDLLVLEANHEPSLLRSGPYPPSVKRRIAGHLGHLSNAEAATFLEGVTARGPAPRVVVAAHLSVANNRPLLARRALERALGRRRSHTRVLVADQHAGAPAIALERDMLTIEPAKHEQLTFAFPLGGLVPA